MKRINLTSPSKKPAPTGTEPVINQECMFVHEKVDDLSI